jgi:hypothetical protein
LIHAIGHQNKTPLGIAERGFAGVFKLRADMKFAPDQDWSSLDPNSQANSVLVRISTGKSGSIARARPRWE